MVESRVGTLFNIATSGLRNPANWLIQALGLGSSSTPGIPITFDTVMGIPEVCMAVQKITGHLAQMDIECRQRTERGKRTSMVYSPDPGARAFSSGTPPFNRFTLIEKLFVDALIYGNGRLYIERNGQGQPSGVYPIPAASTETIVYKGERFHFVTIDTVSEGMPYSEQSEVTQSQYKIPDQDVLYIMGITRNGWWGENPCHLLRDTFGLAIAGQEAAGATFRNAGRPGLILEAPRGAFKTEKDRKEFLDSFNKAHQGLDKAGKTGLIHSGMTAHVLPSDSNSAGYVTQRQFQRESIAMAFLLETVFGDNTGSVYKSVTERNAAYITNCLGRWTGKLEAEADMKLLSSNQRATGMFFYYMNPSMLYKNDRMSLAQYTSSLRQQQAISGNDVREMHGLAPVEGLDDDYSAVGGSPPGKEEEVVPTPDTAADEEPDDNKGKEE